MTAKVPDLTQIGKGGGVAGRAAPPAEGVRGTDTSCGRIGESAHTPTGGEPDRGRGGIWAGWTPHPVSTFSWPMCPQN